MDKDLSDSSESSIGYTIDIVPFTKNTLMFGLYSKMNEFERHFEIISTRYKNIALTWLLGSFAGIGFLFSKEATALPVPHMIGVAIIGLIGLIGISLIGNMDMNVYHRFWASLFVEEMIMEEKHKFLLQSRKIALLIDESKERVFSQGLLYLTSNLILIITIEVALMYEFFYLQIVYLVLMGCASFVVLMSFWLLMYLNNLNIVNTLHRLISQRFTEEGIGNPIFTKNAKNSL